MAFLLVGLCGGLAGVATNYERVSGLLEGVGAKMPLAGLEAIGGVAEGGEINPQVLIAGLQLPGGQGMTEPGKGKKVMPETVIFGPGGNGPTVDPSQLTRGRDQRRAMKPTSIVVVHESDEPEP